LEPGISVTPEGSRLPSRQARAIPVRTCFRPVRATAVMRCLYRTKARTATLNEGTRHVMIDGAAGDLHESRTIEHLEYPIFPADHLRQKEPLECLVRVHEGHSKCVGSVLLGEWKLGGCFLYQVLL